MFKLNAVITIRPLDTPDLLGPLNAEQMANIEVVKCIV
jgi:hypothetical protein